MKRRKFLKQAGIASTSAVVSIALYDWVARGSAQTSLSASSSDSNARSNSGKKLAVRKNIQNLKKHEKAAFVNALKVVKNTFTTGSKVSIYDQLVNWHVLVMGFDAGFNSTGPGAGINPAHDEPAFLPWHREFVYRLEKALQSVDKSVVIPYWDWTDPKALDVIFNDDFLGPKGTGQTLNIGGKDYEGGKVQSGPFSEANGWVLNADINVDILTLQSRGTSLTRFTEIPPMDKYPLSKEYIDRILSANDYLTLRTLIEGWATVDAQGNLTPGWNAHNYIHTLVGGVIAQNPNAPYETSTPDQWTQILGTMGELTSSAYDPIFFLHHCNVDRLWAEWQVNGHWGSNFYPASGQTYGHNLNDRMWPWDGGQSTPGNLNSGDAVSLLAHLPPDDIVKPADVLDFKKLGYTYDTL